MRSPLGRWGLVALAAVVVVVVLVAVALAALPSLVRPVAAWGLRAATGRPVTIAAFDLSLATGHFSVRGVRVNDRDGGLLAEFDALEGRFHRRSLLRGHLWIESLALTNGHVRIVRIGPNRFNVSDLLDRPAGSRRVFDVSVDRFTIAGGWVALEDRTLTPARTWRSDDIRLDARDLTTTERRGTAVGSTTVAGALVTLRVEELRLAPVHLRALVNVRDLDLTLASLYLPPHAPVAIERGTMDAAFTVVVDARDGTALDADAVVERLALRRPGLEGDAVATPELRIMVRELHQRPGSIVLRYASLGGDLTVLDPTTTPPRRLTFSDLTATASGLEHPMTGQAQIALHANVPGGGEIDIGGTAGLEPRRADLRVRARGVELAAIARYLPLSGRLEGIAGADVTVRVSQDRALGLTVTGDTTLDRVALGDGSRTLATAQRVSVTGLEYTWPAMLRSAALTVTRPSVTVERDAEGAVSLVTLLRPAPATGGATEPTSRPAISADIQITQLRIDDGRAIVTDAASGGRVEIGRIAVTARDVTWPGRGAARLQLAANVARAEVTADGTVDAARRVAELAVKVRGTDLATLEPWLPIVGRVRGAASADVTVAVAFEPFALTLRGGVAATDLALLDGTRPLVTVTRADATGVDLRWPERLAIAELRVSAPRAQIERDAQGELSLRPLFARRAGQPTAAPAAAGGSAPSDLNVEISRVRVEDGRALVTDAATGGQADLGRIAVDARDVTWPARGAARVQLAAAVAGGEVSARGTVDLARRSGDLALTLRGADLTALQPWLPIVGRVRGAADADVTLTMALEPFALALRGGIGAANLAFLDGDRPLLTVGRVDATGVDLRWPTQLAIDRLRVDTPWSQIERNPQGQLSLRALFTRRADRPAAPAVPSAPAPPAAAGPVPGMQVTVREALFDNGGTNIVDDAVEPAARFELRGSRLALRNLTWPAQGAASVQIDTPMPGSGILKARGTLSVEPTRLALEAQLDQVDLAPGRPYLPFEARLDGKVSGRVKVNGTFGDTIALVIDGDASVDRLRLGDADRRLARAQRADLTGFRYQYPSTVRVNQVALRKPWLLLERNADGSFEIASLFTPRWAPPQPAPGGGGAPAPPAARVRVLVRKLTMDNGFVRFVDRTTDPDYAEELSEIVLTGEGLSTHSDRHATVDLRGRFASGTPLTVKGTLGALQGPRFLDLTTDVKGFPVTRLNPYLDQLSAWITRQGTLTASLRYKVDGDDLDATNDVTVHDLELEPGGRGAEVRRRVGLPLDTLVSLLKDRQGTIKLNVPVSGRLSAPEFQYGDAVWTAVRNLAIRLVALPFSWIGGMYYTADSRIDSIQVYPVPFETAKATPTAPGAEHLQRLVTFLRESPAIRLRLRPVTTVADVTALRRQALESRLAARGADEADRRRAAVGLYTELFPRRQPPASDEALYEELTRETPPPPRALRALATERVAATRDALVRAGIAPERLQPMESRAAVESEGTGRVEFEITR